MSSYKCRSRQKQPEKARANKADTTLESSSVASKLEVAMNIDIYSELFTQSKRKIKTRNRELTSEATQTPMLVVNCNTRQMNTYMRVELLCLWSSCWMN